MWPNRALRVLAIALAIAAGTTSTVLALSFSPILVSPIPFSPFPSPPGFDTDSLTCKADNNAVAGPFVTPTAEFPAFCNGAPCPDVCSPTFLPIPEGALLALSAPFTCPGPFNCFGPIVPIQASSVLSKTFVIQGIPVGSILEYEVNTFVPLGGIPPFTVRQASVFAYTSTWFLCQNPDGSCPVDPESQTPGFAFPSPFADVFNGVCDTDANGFFKVCVYACVRSKVVICDSPLPTSPVINLNPIVSVNDIAIDIGSLTFGFSIPEELTNAQLSCKPPGDLLVVAGPFVSPTTLFPSLCNGVPCDQICGIPGGQTGALIAQSEPFICSDDQCSGFAVEVTGKKTITKATTISGITVGSSGSFEVNQGVVIEGPVPGGSSTVVAVYGWETVWFKCQLPGGGCPLDPFSVVPGFPVSSPFDEFFDGICPTDSNGFYEVCVYTCITTKTVACVTSTNSIPAGTSVQVVKEEASVDVTDFSFGFPPIPEELVPGSLQCKPSGVPTVVFGPLVSPVVGELPATCNGVPCPEICNIPGQQLGAPVAFSDTFVCPTSEPSCSTELEVAVQEFKLVKGVNVDGFLVGSTAFVSLEASLPVLNVPSGSSAQLVGYIWDTVYFKCQNDDGTCPFDASADAPGLPVSSPFNVFSNQCKTDANGFFQVCVYICVTTKVATCITGPHGVTLGAVFDEDNFGVDVDISPSFPPQPPSLMPSALDCTPPNFPGVVLGPLVSPTLMPLPPGLPVVVSTKCNGVDCPSVCGVPGAQLGAFLVSSDEVTCTSPLGCPALEVSIASTVVSLEKAITVDTFVVGSTADIFINDESFAVGPLTTGETAVVELYAYTTVFFTCQNADGQCQGQDQDGITGAQAVSSPFDLFDGICEPDAQGFFQVCVYSGVKVVAVECTSDGFTHPDFDVISVVNTEIDFTFGFPPPPPGLMVNSLACASAAPGIVLGPLVSPSLMSLPPGAPEVISTVCNGIKCGPVCDVPGAQLGALIGVSDTFQCTGPGTCVGQSLTVSGNMVPLDKALNVAGFEVGSSAVLTFAETVKLSDLPSGSHATVNAYAWTSVFFRCQDDPGLCPIDPQSQTTPLAVSSPFPIFDGICKTDSNGFYLVCVYACLEVKTVECLSDINGTPSISIGSVGMLNADIENFILGFPPPPKPLTPDELTCVSPAAGTSPIVFGPLVSPTLDVQLPPGSPPLVSTVCNGLPCPSVCDVPGAQLGAFVAASTTFDCTGPGSCVGNVLTIEANAVPLSKAVTVGAGSGFTVGSFTELTFKADIAVGSIPSGASVTVNAYAYTSVFFRCQSSPGVCPSDPNSDVTPLAIKSPFNVFAGKCPFDADGFFEVCLYACVKVVAVECLSGALGFPSVTLGNTVHIEDVEPSNFILDFPSPPPGLTLADITCPVPSVGVVLGPLVSPSLQTLPPGAPPVITTQCNGVDCSTVCGIPGAQLGAIVAASDTFECTGPGPCSPTLFVNGSSIPIEKGLNVGGFDVGSSSKIEFSEFITVNSLPPGAHVTIEVYQYTTLWFTCQNFFGCQPTPLADGPPLAISSPFDVFEGACSADINGFFNVCLYASVKLKAVECLSDILGVPSLTIGAVSTIEPDSVSVGLGFPPIPPALQPPALSCQPPTSNIVLGPLVSPTLAPPPPGAPIVVSTTCNGLPCPSVCGIIGNQLGALVGQSDTFVCQGPGPCSPMITVSASSVPLVKSVNVDGFVVGSSADLTFSSTLTVDVPSGSHATVEAYAYTTVSFRCQNPDGSCPSSTVSGAPPVPVSSPFDVFAGICDTDANGFYRVCVYACLKVVAVECISDITGVPSLVDDDVVEIPFQADDFILGFPGPPPGLQTTDLLCVDPTINTGIVFGPLVSPSLQPLPPGAPVVVSTLCNGLPCPEVCDIPGAQLGALIAESPTSECIGPGTCSPVLSISAINVPLNKAVTVGTFTVGSSALVFLDESVIVDIPSGSHATLKAYAYTTVFFKCQTTSGLCPSDPFSIVPGLPVDSPFSIFDGICPTNANGFYQVCVYACLDVKAVTCLSDVNGVPSISIGPIFDFTLTVNNFELDFPPIPPALSPLALACVFPASDIVFGPLVSPSAQMIPIDAPPLISTLCNGLPCPEVCGIPGGPPGALLAVSHTYTCVGPGFCSPTLTVSGTDVELTKAVNVAGFVVGSSVSLNFTESVTVSFIPSQSSVTLEAYAYTTIYFRCQNDDGECPADPDSAFKPLAISSPFEVFEDKCKTNMDGKFRVCLYACVKVVAVACQEDTLDVPTKTIGSVVHIDPVMTSDEFLGFPPLPSELTAAELTHVNPSPLIVLGPLVSPTIEPIPGPAPPVVATFCNGLPCPTVCDLPGQQLGALVAVSEEFTCIGPASCSPTLKSFGDSVPLDKAVYIDGTFVGSSAVLSFDEDITVTGLPSGASVTVNTYAYTSVFFQCQTPTGLCQINPDSDSFPLPISSPFDVFDGICPSDENGFFQVCLYGSIKLVTAECISGAGGIPGVSVGTVDDIPFDVESFVLDFPPPPTPLTPQALSCVTNNAGIVLGPLVSPSLQPLPPGAPALISTVCNGVECGTVCDIPGAQLGALLASSPTFECQGPGPCSPTLNVFAQDLPLDKAVTVNGFVVGSTAAVSFNEDITVSIPSGSHITLNAYAYTSVYFRCQTPTNLCPVDTQSQAPPLAIASPFSIFDGVCDTDANGFFKVCLYACVKVVAVPCISDVLGIPSNTIGGGIETISSTVTDFVLDFADPPPGLTVTDLVVQPNPSGVVFGPLVSPTITTLPPGAPDLITTTCNGVPCSEVCGVPGVQLGALVGQSEPFDCTGPGTCSPTLSVMATAQPLVKSVNVAGFTVGSSVDLSFSSSVNVAGLPSGSSVTIDVYAYTTVYFRCQTNAGTCPPDAASTATPLPIESPFEVFDGLCPTSVNGFFLVCLYAAVKTVTVECITDLNGTPSVSIGDVDEIPTLTANFVLTLPPQPPGLMASDLLCADPSDPTIVFGPLVSPSFQPLPPGAPELISTLCNGLPCPHVCGIPGIQPGAFLGNSSLFVCHGPGDCFKTLTVSGTEVPLNKAVNVAGFDVGSTSTVSFQEDVLVTGLPAEAGVTIEVYGYTSIYFRCQNDDGTCPADPTSDAEPLPVASPFTAFDGICKTDANGNFLTCLYACVKVVTVECIDDVNGLSSKTVGQVLMANSAESKVTLGFPEPPPELMVSALACATLSPGIVFGPLTSPSLQPLPANAPVVVSTKCNGVECGPVCGVPGNQLGALLAVSETFVCSGPGTCNGKVLTIEGTNVPLTKAVEIDSFTVGSFSDVTFSEQIAVTIPSGSHVTLEAHAYTTLFFRCQTDTGDCPADSASDVTPLKVLSPFGTVFSGVCNTNPQGLFEVCLYACLKVVAVECISDIDGIPSLTTGTVTELSPDVNTFTLGFPTPPFPLQTPQLLCKQSDPTIAFGPVVSPSIMEDSMGPPVASTTCNGVECQPVCGLPGAQLGALIGKSEVFECIGPGTCSPTLTINALGSPLNKAVSVAGFSVGSFALFDVAESLTVTSLEPGQHAFVEAQVYTSVWFRCQVGSSCPFDPDSEAAPLPVDSPFGTVFQGICPPNSNGFFPVCVYACTSVKLVQCTSDVFGTTIGEVVDSSLEPSIFILGFPSPPPALTFNSLACKPQAFNDIVFAVSPTLSFPDALCNGVTCDSICGIPGAQLGAFLAASDPFTCTGPGPCSPTLSIVEDDVILNKAVFVGGFTVGSQSSVDLSTSQTISVPSGATATLVAYEWTTVNFKCQTAQGTCPPDFNSLVPGEQVNSPFSEFFDGICPSNPDGTFAVCIYACISVKTVACISDANGLPSTTLGPVASILPTDIKFSFGFPSVPPGLSSSDLACASSANVAGLVAGPFTSPTQEFPATCNGGPCQDVCDIPGGQLGAFIGSSGTFECPSTGGLCHSPSLSFNVTQVDLDKSVAVGGFDVGSNITISAAGSVTLGDLEPGSHATVNLYAYTTVFFKCQVLTGMLGSSNFGCLPDPNSIVPGLPVASPLSQFFGNANCPIDLQGNSLVCVYACVSVKAVECLSDANNTPGTSIGGVSDVDDTIIDFEFFDGDAIPPLGCTDAVLGQDGVVFGPVVSPTLDFPANCDGVPCGPICEEPGQELGGLIASSEVFECAPPAFSGCPTTLTIEVIGEVLVKEVQVEAFTVGSTTKVSSPALTINTVVPVGTSSQYNLYAWSTTTFRCGIPQSLDNTQFVCPPDASAFAVQPVFSPLSSFFDGVCPEAPNGTFIVCVYACQQLEAVLCSTDAAGMPSIVSFNEVDPLITFDVFEFGVPDVVLSYGELALAPGGGILVPVFYRSIVPIFGYQVEFTGPTPIELSGGASDVAMFSVQFSPVFDLFLGISLQGNSITTAAGAPQLLFNLIFNETDTGMEFCILTSDLSIQTVFSGAAGVALDDIFDGNNCIIVESPPCTTAGTGDVTLDGVINIQDIVLLLSFIVQGTPPTDPCLFLTADVVPDGVINIQDVVAVAAIITS